MERQGATGALLDLYEQAIADLKITIEHIPDLALTIIVDHRTMDENCKTIQAILAHVVHSGYGYATYIHNSKGNHVKRPEKTFHTAIKKIDEELTDVFNYTEKVFAEIKDDELEQMDDSLKIKSGWGQLYDIEQLMEHAIVHILRHNRQIKNIIRNKLAG
jgi:uncharacterized damage-inducible protein DinB